MPAEDMIRVTVNVYQEYQKSTVTRYNKRKEIYFASQKVEVNEKERKGGSDPRPGGPIPKALPGSAFGRL